MGPEHAPSSPAPRSGWTGARAAAALALVALFVLAAPLSGWIPGHSSGSTSPEARVGGHASTGFSPTGTLASGTSRGIPRPAAITLTAAGLTPAAIALGWSGSGVLFASNDTVQYSLTGAAGSWVTVAVVQPGVGSYVQTGLTPGGTYYWQVIEYGLGTATSNTISPTQPTLAYLNYTTPSSSTAKFTWTNNATYGGGLSFSEYDLFQRTGTGAPVRVANITQVGTTNDTVLGLSAGTSYSFYLETIDCASGCPSANIVTQSNTVTYGTPQALAVTVSAQRAVVDAGQLDYLTCSPSGGTPKYTFQWDFGNGTFVAGGSSLSHAYPNPSTNTVTCQVTDSTSTRASQATSVQVNARPTLTLNQNRTAVDVGQPIEFGCVPAQGTPPFTVQWTFGDGSAGANTPIAHTYTAPGTFAATCLATDQTSTVVAASVSVPVSSLLKATASVDHPAAAPGSSLTFQVHPANGSGSYPTPRWWSFGDGATVHSAGDTANHAFTGAGTFTVRVQLNDSNGATVLASTSVTVSPIAVHLSAAPHTIAENSRATFSASASGGAGGPYNFSWQFGDGGRAYGATVNYTFKTVGTFAVTLVVHDALGATNTSALPSIAVSGPVPWLTASVIALLALVIGLVLAFLGYVWLRRRERAALHAQSGRVPMTPPSETVRGAKICRWCGASNLPLRDTCANCGRPLRKM